MIETVDRPWGHFEVLKDSPKFKVKRLKVAPHQSLSYQSHSKRTEFWVVVDGEGELTIDDATHQIKVGDTALIPAGSKHRLSCSSLGIEVVEVQTGTYFGEDDIIRYEDIYGRV